MDFTIWAWSDYRDLYSLNLAAGTNCDIIFTAPWCYLWSEASNGSFMALSDDFITENMPLTRKYQIADTWNGVKLAGDIIAIPQNTTNPNGKIVAIRQDLADKYGIGELKSWDDYKNYLLTIAEKETPESGVLATAASGGNAELWDVYRQQFDTMVAVSTQDYISYLFQYQKGVIPTKDDLTFIWTSDWFKDFCKDMNELTALLNEAGVPLPDELLDGVAGGVIYRVHEHIYRNNREEIGKVTGYIVVNDAASDEGVEVNTEADAKWLAGKFGWSEEIVDS